MQCKRWSLLMAVWVGIFISPLYLKGQQVYYVSSSGREEARGSLQDPMGSLQLALQKAKKSTGDVVIYLRKGVYPLENTLVLNAADFASVHSLKVCAFPGEEVVLSGGKSLHLDWKPYKKGIMKAKMEQPLTMDMLIVNGEIRSMARFPNYDPQAVRFNGTSAEATHPQRVKRWKHPEGGYLHAMHQSDWGDFHYRITGKNKKGELQLEGGWQNNRKSGLHPENRMVENIFEELDAPGEWFYDQVKKELYYYPMEGERLSEVVVETPQLKHLIELRGSETTPIRNISFEGLSLTQTVRTFMEEYEPLLRSDWTVYRGAAVFIEGSEHCAIKNCDLYNLGGNAVFFSKYNRYSEVSGCHFTQIGASAICFIGDPGAVRSPSFEYGQSVELEKMDREKGPKTNNFPAECLVEDNLIHKIGLFEKQITGVELSMSQSITVRHNSIYDTPRAGINISEGTWGGHVIENNDVFDTVKETGDHGSFNSWGRDRFWHPNYGTIEKIAEETPELILADAVKTTVIRNNRFRCDRGWDIDLDDGSSNYHIYNNLCLNGGIKLREGFYRTVENNIMVNNSFHPHVWFLNSGDVFTRNIVMTAYQPIRIREWGLMADYNLFAAEDGLEKARKDSTDAHSIVVDLPFKDPSAGDFTLPDQSDAITKGGFRNFPMDEFGVTSPRLKSIARQPKMPILMTYGKQGEDATENWHGLSIKNLTTLGERSATGMDSERGVYVISVTTSNCPFRDYIHPNDVILKVGDTEVNDLKTLHEAIRKLGKKDSFEMVIFRSQKENKVTVPMSLLQ